MELTTSVDGTMPASITFFPVSNGDMTLICLDNGQTILIDCNIRGDADNEEDDTPDVASDLRDRLKQDARGRRYVDAFLLSHPDRDHVGGLRNHFHLGPPDEWSEDDDKICISEMWSSPTVFRRASANNLSLPFIPSCLPTTARLSGTDIILSQWIL